jgi:hypothetical protein
MCAYMHTYTNVTYVRRYIKKKKLYRNTYQNTCMYIYEAVCSYIYQSIYTGACMRVCVCSRSRAMVCVCVCVCVFVCTVLKKK